MRPQPVILFTLLVLLSGCATPRAPIEDVRGAPIISRHPLSLDQVAAAIARAGTSLGWETERVDPHHMIAALHLYRAHAVVWVHFTARTYDLFYRSSAHLHARDGEIDPRYNEWLHRLARQIALEIECMGRRPCPHHPSL